MTPGEVHFGLASPRGLVEAFERWSSSCGEILNGGPGRLATVAVWPEEDVGALVQTAAASFDATTFTLDCVNVKEQRINRMNRTKLVRRSATTGTTSIGTIAKQHAEASHTRRDL
jgi:hypothetical protein